MTELSDKPGPDRASLNLHRRQLTGTMQLGKPAGVASVSLDPIVQTARNKRRGDHHAGMTCFAQLALAPYPHGPARLVAENAALFRLDRACPHASVPAARSRSGRGRAPFRYPAD